MHVAGLEALLGEVEKEEGEKRKRDMKRKWTIHSHAGEVTGHFRHEATLKDLHESRPTRKRRERRDNVTVHN